METIKSIYHEKVVELPENSIEAYTIGRSSTVKRERYSIICKNGTYHFDASSKLERGLYCDNKLIFPSMEVAELYAEYLGMKYRIYNRAYCCEECWDFHLTSS